jgi:hypothetical protein
LISTSFPFRAPQEKGASLLKTNPLRPVGVQFVILALSLWLTQSRCRQQYWHPAGYVKNVLLLVIHLLTVVAKLLGPGGMKAGIAENLSLKQQLLVVCRRRQRAPNLLPAGRFLLGFFSQFLRPGRIVKTAVGIRPSC